MCSLIICLSQKSCFYYQVTTGQDWQLAPGSIAAGSKATTDSTLQLQQHSSTAQNDSHPQTKINITATTADANGEQQSTIAEHGSPSTGQQLTLQQALGNSGTPILAADDNHDPQTPLTSATDADHGVSESATELPAPPSAASAQPDPLQGLAACATQMDDFGAMCGSGNKEKLQGFLQTIFDYQQVIRACMHGLTSKIGSQRHVGFDYDVMLIVICKPRALHHCHWTVRRPITLCKAGMQGFALNSSALLTGFTDHLGSQPNSNKVWLFCRQLV